MTPSNEFSLRGGIDIRTLPKVSLHDHLDGGLRPQTILDLAAEAGVPVPVDTADELADWIVERCDTGNLVDYLDAFALTTAVMQDAAALERVAREFVQDLGADGVIYGEVRWAPEQHQRAGLSLEETVEAVQQGIEHGIEDLARAGHHIRVGQILTAMRHADRSLEIAELAVRFRDEGVVGFDIAGAEEGFPASAHRLAFDYLAENLFPVTVHAGEADGLASIRSALLDGRALRLGHGVRIAEDVTVLRSDEENTFVSLGRLGQWVKDREIPLELSPTSNLQTGAVAAWGDAITEHPFDLLYQLGFRVTVNVDNRLMGGASLSSELSLLADAFGYELEDLEQFQINAARASFLPREDREELVADILDGFDDAAERSARSQRASR